MPLTAVCVIVAALPAASVKVPLLSVSLFASMLMPSASVWLASTVYVNNKAVLPLPDA